MTIEELIGIVGPRAMSVVDESIRCLGGDGYGRGEYDVAMMIDTAMPNVLNPDSITVLKLNREQFMALITNFIVGTSIMRKMESLADEALKD